MRRHNPPGSGPDVENMYDELESHDIGRARGRISRRKLFVFAAEVCIVLGAGVCGLALYLWGIDKFNSSPARQHRKNAILAMYAGDYDGAIAEYKQAAQLDPGNAVLRYELGTIYKNLGRMDEAVAAWNESLRIDPTFTQASISLHELDAPRLRELPSIDDGRMKARHDTGTVESLSWDALRGAP